MNHLFAKRSSSKLCIYLLIEVYMFFYIKIMKCMYRVKRIHEFVGQIEPRINLKCWFKTRISLGCTVSKFVLMQSWAPMYTVGFWIVALYLSRAARKAYLGDKTSQFRGNDTEDHGRRIICIVLQDNSFIIDDCRGRCTYFYGHNLVNINVCCQFYSSSYSSASTIYVF